MRRQRTNWKLSDYLLHAIAIPLRFLYGVLVTPLDRRSLRKRGSQFAEDVTDTYAALLKEYDGKVIPKRGEQSFDYVAARIEFPDRTFDILYGRGEFTVSLFQLGERIEVFFEEIQTSEDRDARGLAALMESAGFVARCWDRLPEASYLELRQMRNERA